METITLEASPRSLQRKARYLRKDGKIPAVYYGRGKTPLSLELDYQSFRKTYEKAGSNTIVTLALDDQKFPVLIHEVQFDPVKDLVSHVDFLHVDMTKEVTTRVPVRTKGLAPAVKDLAGILTVHKREITIRCLPQDLIHEIELDVSGLKSFHNAIHVRDLAIPSAIKVLDHPDDTVVNVTPPRVEEEEVKPAPAAAAVPGAPQEGAAPAAGATGGAPTPPTPGAQPSK